VAIGDQVRALRVQRGWSQAELARRSGVDQGRISRLESGETLNPQPETLLRLSEALQVPLTAIVGRPSPATIHAVVPGRAPVPIVRVPAHAGADWTWEPTGQVTTIDDAVARARDLLGVIVVGECMVPDVMDGDLVIFDRAARQPRDRDMVVVTRDNQVLVRWARVADGAEPELVDNAGVALPPSGDDAVFLEGIVVEVRRQRPRRRDWHDLAE